MDIQEYMREKRQRIEEALETSLPSADVLPHELLSAVRYSLLSGGKRLRPILCLASAEACGGAEEEAMPAACAVEMVHVSSLIHDDLPAMDDDDFRRGEPTCHKVFGEATALLAGDWLMTYPFLLLSRDNGAVDSQRRLKIIQELAEAISFEGMISGQVEDLMYEGSEPTLEKVQLQHAHKTGALFVSSVRMGAISAGASPEELSALTGYSQRLGLSFQIVDDILDATSTLEELGKAVGKDSIRRKVTFPAVCGLEESRAAASKLCQEACSFLEAFGEKAGALKALAQFMVERTS